MTIAMVLVGADRVFMAADSRAANAIDGAPLPQESKKLHQLDGPVLAVTAGFGSNLTGSLVPMVISVMKAKGSAGDLDFIDEWLGKLGEPIFSLGCTLLKALGGADPQLVVAFGGVGENGPRARIKRFDGGLQEEMEPGSYSVFGTDTDVMKAESSVVATRCLGPNQTIQADQWAYELCRWAAERWPNSVGFPLTLMAVGRTGGVSTRIERAGEHFQPAAEFSLRI